MLLRFHAIVLIFKLSDDEDDTHPNIDTPSLFRWRHQARVERMEKEKQEKEELERNKNKCAKSCTGIALDFRL